MYKYLTMQPFNVTKKIILLCVALWVIDIVFPLQQFLALGEYSDFWNSVASKPWTLLTQEFLHCPVYTSEHGFILMGLLHIYFNIYAMKDLGQNIENNEKKWFYLTFIITSAIISNFVQCYFINKTAVGFSGVLFAMFGYMAINTKLRYKYCLPKGMIVFGIAFMLICCLLPGIGNYAHIAGFIYGAIVGIIAYKINSLKFANICLNNELICIARKKRMQNLD